ncbi:MAG: alpha-glucosidase C-terminal domain-containing protein [Chitinophagaceae bacterium]|nr:alpha-glucosidase C-terminal domain-containing protein [Chitinophagaceae bacterium]
MRNEQTKTVAFNSSEIIYHVFQRSFYDSNGDGHGDLKGLTQKLDYILELGATSILLTPLYKSAYYHNYFAEDFEAIDTTYGSLEDYLQLVRAVHGRNMKIYMDMEIQYITEDHKWYKDSYQNPASPYSEYIVYKDAQNTEPESIIFNLNGQLGYNNLYRNITTVNLLSKKVQEYLYGLFRYWIDPHKNGSCKDGVDGFRLDHMMDMLDNKPHLDNLFSDFWKPLITRLQALKPGLVFIAEQTDWDSSGNDHLLQGGVSCVFAFQLREAILTFDKNNIAQAAEAAFETSVDQQVVFIENHDIHRFASLVNNDAGKIRVGAALNILIGGIPAIYYGQEIGMLGEGGFGRYGDSDGNDIPRREAFRWYKQVEGEGMTLWYRDTGPWWNDSTLRDGDGISVEEQQNNPASLWNYYRQLIALRKEYKAFSLGTYSTLQNNNQSIFSFARTWKNEIMVIVVNLSDRYENVEVALTEYQYKKQEKSLRSCIGDITAMMSPGNIRTSLPPYETGIWKLEPDGKWLKTKPAIQR